MAELTSAQPPLMVYNRSPRRVDEFKSYASDNSVKEEHYVVVQDIKEIGEKWVRQSLDRA